MVCLENREEPLWLVLGEHIGHGRGWIYEAPETVVRSWVCVFGAFKWWSDLS